MFWGGWRSEIYEDIDGSLTGKQSRVWITPQKPHLAVSKNCTNMDEKLNWDDALICTKQVVRISFY